MPNISEPMNACRPSPCGSYSQCREINSQAVCSCISDYIGSPPTCHPECTISSDCPSNESCVNQKCVDPCDHGTCGLNANCRVVNHTPICSCAPGYTGNPFIQCSVIGIKQPNPVSPCVPSPCGENTICSVLNNIPTCKCLPRYTGNPIQNCYPNGKSIFFLRWTCSVFTNNNF